MKTKRSQIIPDYVTVDFVCRVYGLGLTIVKIVIMGSSDGIINTFDYITVSKSTGCFQSDYVDKDHPIHIDGQGMQYTVWKNSEFMEPFTLQDIIDRFEYYKMIENE